MLALLLNSCATTKPPDVPLCLEFTPISGKCVTIITGREIEVDEEKKFENKTWWELRPTMIQMPASSWAQIKAFIIKACKKYDACQKEVSSWDRTIDIIDKSYEEKTGALP